MNEDNDPNMEFEAVISSMPDYERAGIFMEAIINGVPKHLPPEVVLASVANWTLERARKAIGDALEESEKMSEKYPESN